MEAGKFESFPAPSTFPYIIQTRPIQNKRKSFLKLNTYKDCKINNLNKTSTSSEQDHNTSLHKKCVICMYKNLYLNESIPSSELLELIQVWVKLPEQVKTDIGLLTEPYELKNTNPKIST